jgi:hypothetical protein
VVQKSILASGVLGEAVTCEYSSSATLSCSDVFGNEGGDFVGCIASQDTLDGNFSADPLFCDPVNDDLTLRPDSPCMPGNHPYGADCGLIGAMESGCGPISIESDSWGKVKERFRE